MSNTRTAESTVHTYRSTGSFDTRYETDYHFAKREYGGWHIILDNPNAKRTVEFEWYGSSTTDGSIGWVVKSTNGKGWDLYHALAGEIEAISLGRGWDTRDEATEELIWSLLSRNTVSPAREGNALIARDTIDHNELVKTASRVVEQFGWEAEYDAWKASQKNQELGG